MKKLLIILTLFISISSFATTYQDHVECSISAKVGSKSSRLESLPRTLGIGMDVLAEGFSTDILGLEKNVYHKEWKRYGYSTVEEAVSNEADEIINISSLRKYTTNDVYVNRYGIHNNRVKEFKIKLKPIKKNMIKVLLNELGYSDIDLSSANKNLVFKNDTEFDHKSFSTTIKFPKENVSAIFTFSCKNSIQLSGKQYY